MRTVTLYRYTRPDGGTTVSPIQPEGSYTTTLRLIADEGKVLTNGVTETSCVDTDSADGWVEVDAPEIEVIEEWQP